MKRAISGKLAKKIDTYSIDNGMPSLVLMESGVKGCRAY